MQIQKKMLVLALAAPLALGGCTGSKLIGERVGADLVVVAEPAQAAACKPLGKTTVNVLTTVGPFTRSAEAVEDNLNQMARNEAVNRAGDTVVRGNSMEYGKRTYDIFKCKP